MHRCIFAFCLVGREKSTADCISAAACRAEASGRRPGGNAEISTGGSSTGQPDYETQAQEKTKDTQRSGETTWTV